MNLRYLKRTPNHSHFYQTGSTHLEAYSDVDYVGSPDDHHSIRGYCICLGHNPHTFSAKKHRTVSRSSTEAKYHQLTTATIDGILFYHNGKKKV